MIDYFYQVNKTKAGMKLFHYILLTVFLSLQLALIRIVIVRQSEKFNSKRNFVILASLMIN